jgi:type III restriction enzyme
MFAGQDVPEKVSVIGTQPFMEFVESIKVEGVELEYQPMGAGTGPKSPMVVEVDRENTRKDIENLDIEVPVLAPRIYREYKNLDEIEVAKLCNHKLPVRQFSEEQQREIVFRDIDTEETSHTTVLDTVFAPNYQNVVGFFTRNIMRDLRLVGGFDVLFGKVKAFVETELFQQPVDLSDLNVLRNLSEIEVVRTIIQSFKTAINALTVQVRGSTEIRDTIKLSKTRPYLVNEQAFIVPKRSMFNKIVGDSGFELDMAAFLDGCEDIISFVKNSQSTQFRIEYRTADGGIANYYPDFLVKRTNSEIWLIETKGREDLDDPPKWERLQLWCTDATARDEQRVYKPLFVRQADFEKYQPQDFAALIAVSS